MPEPPSQKTSAEHKLLRKVDDLIAAEAAECKLASRLAPIAYRVGDMIDFGREVELCVRTLSGFSFPEITHRWSLGSQCCIELALHAPLRGDHCLELHFFPFTALGRPNQVVQLSCNNSFVASWKASAEEERYDAIIPGRLLVGSRSLFMEIVTPDAWAPCEADLSEDTRKLGIALRRLRISRLEASG